MYVFQDDDVEEPHDGFWAGIAYYKCKPNRGIFVLLSGLKLGIRDEAEGTLYVAKYVAMSLHLLLHDYNYVARCLYSYTFNKNTYNILLAI